MESCITISAWNIFAISQVLCSLWLHRLFHNQSQGMRYKQSFVRLPPGFVRFVSLSLCLSLSLFDDNCLLECQLWKPVSSNRRHLSTVYDVCDTLLVKVSCRVAFIPLSILQTFPVILFTKRCVPRVKDHSLCCVIKKREDKKTLLTHLCPNGLGWRTWWRTALGFVVNTQTTSHHEKLSKLP